MTDNSSDILKVLTEIRDGQRQALARQEQILDYLQEQTENAKEITSESIELQRVAVARAKRAGMIALPLIIGCILLLIYLFSKYSI